MELEIYLEDLPGMNETTQLKLMRDWFLTHYEDPAHSLPFETAEGGYIWIDGGPYDPHDVLYEKFSEVVPEEVIESIAADLSEECAEWAKQIDLSIDDFYRFDPSEHFDDYRTAMDKNRAVLAIEVHRPLQNTFYGMAFVNLITIMETYLSDTFISVVTRSERFMRAFVATTPEFKDQKIPLSEIYKSLDKISEITEEYLNAVVWHRLDIVKNMYRDTLNVSFPDRLGNIFRAIRVRHALVHHNGKMDGKYVEITKQRVEDLAREIDSFISSVAQQIQQLYDEEENVSF